MAVFVSAEGAANGTDVSSGTLTAGGDTTPTSVAKNSGTTIKHSTARAHTGTRSIQWSMSPSAAGFIRFTHNSTSRSVQSAYLLMESLNTGYIELLAFRHSSGAATRFALSNGYPTLTTAQTALGPSQLNLNVWYRIELVATPGGSTEAYLYQGDSTTPEWSASGATGGNGAAFTLTALGSSGGPQNSPVFYIDDYRVEERASGLLGPYPPQAADFTGAGSSSASGDSTGVPIIAAPGQGFATATGTGSGIAVVSVSANGLATASGTSTGSFRAASESAGSTAASGTSAGVFTPRVVLARTSTAEGTSTGVGSAAQASSASGSSVSTGMSAGTFRPGFAASGSTTASGSSTGALSLTVSVARTSTASGLSVGAWTLAVRTAGLTTASGVSTALVGRVTVSAALTSTAEGTSTGHRLSAPVRPYLYSAHVGGNTRGTVTSGHRTRIATTITKGAR